jgi:anti-sigma factor RsiW
MTMNCDELQTLHGAYLDSELDARTTLEIQRHFAVCPDCSRAFAWEAELDAQIAAGLKRGRRTARLWDQIEQSVVAVAETKSRAERAPEVPLRMPWWRELLWPSPQAWAGLAALWIVMLGASFITGEPANLAEGRQAAVPSRELRQVLRQQQQQMLAELGGVPEKLIRKQPDLSAPQPRSERQSQLSNT